MIQTTSIIAYNSLTDLGSRQYQVLEHIYHGKSVCNLDIALSLNLPINQVTGRTKELVDMGLVTEGHKSPNPHTGRTVIYWELTSEGEKLFTKKTFIPFGQLNFL